jgi:aminopeptidase YwaD
MRNIIYKLAVLALVFTFQSVSAQDKEYAVDVIKKLASPEFHGRGYIKKGDHKAARFIAKEFKKDKLKYFGDSYFQYFNMPMNTLPGKIELGIDDVKLNPGTEFLVASSSPAMHGTFGLVWFDGDTAAFKKMDLHDKFVVVKGGNIRDLCLENPFHSKGIIIPIGPDDNLWWHVSNGFKVNDFMTVIVRSEKLNESSQTITMKVKNRFIPDYRTQNVIAWVKGSVVPDSFLVVTAHYDHLGQMGSKTYFPGANDNASGTAMVMDLARHYSLPENRPAYSMVFMAFAGEEAGLLGSSYDAEHPLFPLGKVAFLVNLDMVGTGDQGITVVNATAFQHDFDKLVEFNDEYKLLPEVAPRGESCNSDHCPFYMKGVPSFFIYTRSKIYNEYHSVKDRAEDLPMTGYDGLFRLLEKFFKYKS